MRGFETMRLTRLFLLALCTVGWSCGSATGVEERDASLTGYSLLLVDGQAVPTLFSSLPGLLVWEGENGTKLALWQGQVVCNEDGTAEERYGFRLSTEGSEVWDPIMVELDLTCEFDGTGLVTFRYPATGEVQEGAFLEGFEGCPALTKEIPTVETLRSGYRPSMSQAEFPEELEFPAPLNGEFRLATCMGM
jgi:hypothetical protein